MSCRTSGCPFILDFWKCEYLAVFGPAESCSRSMQSVDHFISFWCGSFSERCFVLGSCSQPRLVGMCLAVVSSFLALEVPCTPRGLWTNALVINSYNSAFVDSPSHQASSYISRDRNCPVLRVNNLGSSGC